MNAAPSWIDPAMRVGFSARGVVFVIVGAIALTAAFAGGQTEGTKGALQELMSQPFGQVLLALVAAGLLAYAAYRFLSAGTDLDLYGSGAKGMVARIGLAVSGLTHLALAVYAASLIFGVGSGGGGGSREHWTATLMAQPFGQWLVGLLGAVVVGVGVYYAVKALKEKYKPHMRQTRTSERLDPLVKFGLIAYGLVIVIVGGFFVWAAITADPSKAGGLQEALETLRRAAFGRILLGVTGAGLLAFSGYCFVQARYRIVPRASAGATMTLSGKSPSQVVNG